MKFISFTYLLLLSFLFTNSLYAESFAKVIFVDGDAMVWRKLKMVPLKKGDLIQYKDQIITKNEQRVTLQNEEGHKIYILSNTKLKVPEKKSKDVVLNQEEGSLWLNLKPIAKEKSFKVRTPTAVAGVRGTKFITMILENRATDLCVCEGEVELEVNGNKKIAKTGEGVKAMPEASNPGMVFNNQSFIRQRRRLSRKPACMNCHSGGGGYNESSLEGDRLILR